jgi:pimeloyl-ACP methyl ester carboxylesterase
MAAIPRFAIDTLPGVGHYAFEEAPTLVLDVIRRVAPPTLLSWKELE